LTNRPVATRASMNPPDMVVVPEVSERSHPE
jgi:hypothetical protein